MSDEMTEMDASRRVLIVEDEPRLRDMLMRAVRGMEFVADAAGSGEEALRRIERDRYSIILLDLNLPGMSGMDLFAALRARRPAVQVVILTGFGDLETARQAIRLDVADFLTKPCTLGEIEAALDRAWKRIGVVVRPALRDSAADAAPAAARGDLAAARPLRDLERDQILAALDRHQGNRDKAARELGISVRTLYYRLAQYSSDEQVRPTGASSPQ